MSAHVRDTDNGYKELVERVFGMAKAKPRIDVGILEAAGAEAAQGADEAITLIEVAIINEFGSEDGKHPPARSFIRAWFDENEAKLREDLTKLMQLVVAGRSTKEQILELLAQKAVGQIQERIAAGIEPENKKATIDKKGSSTPLIDTEQLRSSVSYKIEDG